jgi:hypothetical protein
MRRAASVFQGRGELRDQPPPGARVATDPKGLFGPEPDHRPVGGCARSSPRPWGAPSRAAGTPRQVRRCHCGQRHTSGGAGGTPRRSSGGGTAPTSPHPARGSSPTQRGNSCRRRTTRRWWVARAVPRAPENARPRRQRAPPGSARLCGSGQAKRGAGNCAASPSRPSCGDGPPPPPGGAGGTPRRSPGGGTPQQATGSARGVAGAEGHFGSKPDHRPVGAGRRARRGASEGGVWT